MYINSQEDYVQALKRHDWGYQYTDDHSVWLRGDAERQRLVGARAEFDPTWSIWNQHCPVSMIVENSHA